MDLLTKAQRAYSSRLVRRVAPVTILLVLTGLMVRFGVRESATLRLDLLSLRFELVAASVVLAVASNLGTGLFWRTVVTASGESLSLGDALRIWCLSTPAKYGLGAITHYAGRVYLATKAGASRHAILVSLPLELAMIAFSGIVVLLVSAPAGGGLLLPDAYSGIALAGPLIAIASVVFLPALAGRVAQSMPKHWWPGLGSLSGSSLRAAALAMIPSWLLFAATSFVLLQSMVATDITLYPTLVFVVTLAILLGFVAITPLGLGVREVTLMVLLSQVVPPPVAAATAVLHRLVTIVAELLCVVGVLLIQAVTRSPAESTQMNGDSIRNARHHETP